MLSALPTFSTNKTLKKMSKIYQQKYRIEWESVAAFKGWLKPFEGDDSRAYCDYCNTDFYAKMSDIKKHAATRKHHENGPKHLARRPLMAIKVDAAKKVPHSAIVQLNVGGHLFTSTLGTLRKVPNSKLADMLSGPSKHKADTEGRLFIDRDGTHFGQVLEYLRAETLPSHHLQEVYREAVYYGLRPLVKLLEETPQLFGETVGRQQFLSRVPNYQENLEIITRVARAEAIAARYSNVIVCVLRSEEDLARYSDALHSLNAEKESVVSFGPWKAPATVEDLLDCIKMDIEAKGYRVSFQPHQIERTFTFKSYDFFYKLTFKWW